MPPPPPLYDGPTRTRAGCRSRPRTGSPTILRTNIPARRGAERDRGDSMKKVLALLVCGVTLAGCSNLTPTENRAAGGTLAGATGGAIIGALAGNAALGTVIGAGAGLAGGLIYDHVKKSEQSAYQQGYAAGRSSQ